MKSEKYNELVQRIQTEMPNRIDFKNGVIQHIDSDKQETGCIFDVRWKRNIHFILRINKWSGVCQYYAERNGEQVSWSRYASKIDDKFYKSIQHLVNEIENGDFIFKKNISEQITEIVCERQLTSCMNNTKWKEFVNAMNEEMSIRVPYDYKTLFEENRDDLLFGTHYDIESFNGYYFKSIEWVKVMPKFDECNHRGMLIEDEKIHYDVEKEFIDLMKKYSIPYEYDEKNELYTIYGYK